MRVYLDNWESKVIGAVSATQENVVFENGFDMEINDHAILTLQNADASKFELVKCIQSNGNSATIVRGANAHSYEEGECIALIAATSSSFLEPTEKVRKVTSGVIDIKNGTVQHIDLTQNTEFSFLSLGNGQSVTLNIFTGMHTATFQAVNDWYGHQLPLEPNKKNVVVISNELNSLSGYYIGAKL